MKPLSQSDFMRPVSNSLQHLPPSPKPPGFGETKKVGSQRPIRSEDIELTVSTRPPESERDSCILSRPFQRWMTVRWMTSSIGNVSMIDTPLAISNRRVATVTKMRDFPGWRLFQKDQTFDHSNFPEETFVSAAVIRAVGIKAITYRNLFLSTE
jgi:hypothetical protein